jgi:hypothetical protein
MSANAEVRNEAVRRLFAAFEGEDDAFRAALHPEIEWYPIEENRTPTHGIEAALWNRNQWLDTWDEHQLDLEEVLRTSGTAVPATAACAGHRAARYSLADPRPSPRKRGRAPLTHASGLSAGGMGERASQTANVRYHHAPALV